MKVIIAGSRDFNDYEYLEKILKRLFINSSCTIISGCAKGADRLGLQYAKKNGLRYIEMPVDWNKYGKKAGYLRNVEMAKIADMCIVFWDGKSKGSKHMIDIAKNWGIGTVVIKYKELENKKGIIK